jgi:hypothetical protein
MIEAIILASIRYALPAIMGTIAAHQAANGGAMPTPDHVLANTPALQILAQGQAWLLTRAAPPSPPAAPTP